MTVEQFKNEYAFLSSMHPVPEGIETPDGFVAKTVEHVYQADKFTDPEIRRQILEAESGYKAKNLANTFEKRKGYQVRHDWKYQKVDRMRDLVYQKFTRSRMLGDMLLATDGEELIEGNTWNDTFWGVSPPQSHNGLNWLGRILMETRDIVHEQRVREAEAAVNPDQLKLFERDQ